MKKIILTLLSTVALGHFSQATSRSAESSSGHVEVYPVNGGFMIVAVSGEAAKTLFDSLQVEVEVPPFSTSQVKTKNRTQCTKYDDAYDCMIAINTQ